jgi:hypothetical protein
MWSYLAEKANVVLLLQAKTAKKEGIDFKYGSDR